MDKSFYKTLITDTFEKSFDKERFLFFIKNLLNNIDESKAFHARGYVKEKYKSTVKTYERTGTYTDSNGKKIDILIVYLIKDFSLDKARTTLRNFAAEYLKDRAEKNAGLVAFVPPKKSEWRFSFVKMEYELAEDTKGKLKGVEKFTPARRYSFLVGENENSHTAKSRLIPILATDKNPTLEEIEEGFSVEIVTKEFFLKYHDLFIRLKESLDEVAKNDTKVREDFENKNIDTINFSKKLLGQIVFIYFLQKKGWFGVKRNQEWGAGSKHFLRELFEKKHGEYINFFNDILEPLFYEALRLERPGDYYSRFDCRIPFLNGGLFDPINEYFWWDTDILIPNELFSNQYLTKEGDEGDGILDIFDRYNFTVKEDEPLEKEVAVDPEMLGKVFENLLEVKDKKSKGTYYTPREIVHYMCQESLALYLSNELESYISKEDIDTLIRYGETTVEHDTKVVEKGHEIGEYFFKIPKSVRNNANLIDKKLESIRICDPAVGSGAFPVGMMNEIVKIRNSLTPHLENKQGRTLYNFKRHSIQNCLYGVDIDPGAVEIAKLRLWLSLIVEEEDFKNIRPLPNLDYKMMKGNSLQFYPYTPQWINELEPHKKKYFEETNPKKKIAIKKEIDSKIQGYFDNSKNALGYIVDFDFKMYFSEVFNEKNGFDIVIENPPYVRVDEISKVIKTFYKKNYKSACGKYDLYYLFFELSISLAHKSGICVFISPNKFCAANSGLALRKIILKSGNRAEIISTSKLKIFEQASNYPVITLLNKETISESRFETRQVDDLRFINEKHRGKRYVSTLNNLEILPDQVIPINIDQKTFNFLIKLYKNERYLSEFVKINEGLRIPELLESESQQENKIVKQYQFSRYSKISEGSFISDQNLLKVIAANSERYINFQKDKILIAEDALRISATIDLDLHVPQGGVYYITVLSSKSDLYFILGLLNSRLMSFVYEALYSGMHMGGGYLRYRSKFLEKLPYPRNEIDSDLIKKIKNIVATIHDNHDPTNVKMKKLDNKIDGIVNQIYKIDSKDAELVN